MTRRFRWVTHTFDSFECAIHAVAPTCPHCGIHVVGHGVEKDGNIFCVSIAPRRRASTKSVIGSDTLSGPETLPEYDS